MTVDEALATTLPPKKEDSFLLDNIEALNGESPDEVSSIKFNESNLAYAEGQALKQSPKPITRKAVVADQTDASMSMESLRFRESIIASPGRLQIKLV